MAANALPPDGPAGKRKGRRWLFMLAGLVLVLAALYAAGWFYAAGRLQQKAEHLLSQLGQNGRAVTCKNLAAQGFPLRFGFGCASLTYSDSRGVSASANGLSVAARLFDPARVTADLAAPAALEVPGIEPLRLDWRSLSAELGLARPLARGVSVAGRALKAAFTNGKNLATAASVSGRVRPQGADLSLSLRFAGFALDPALLDGKALPPLGGLAEIEVADGVALVSGSPASLRDRSGTIRTLSLSLPNGGGVSVSGPVSVDSGGLVDADLRVSLENPAEIAAALGAAMPDKSQQIGNALAGLSLIGAGGLPLRIEKGKARIAFIPLGEIPPLD